MALGKSSPRNDLPEWLKSRFGHSRLEKVRWFEVGIHTMVASRAFARGAAPEVAEETLSAYRAVLQEAGVSLKSSDRIAKIIRKVSHAPQDQRIFAQLLKELEEQARIQSASAMLRPRSNPLAAGSYYLTVAMVITLALVSFSKSAPPFLLPLVLVAGLVLSTAIGGFGAFRD